MSSLQSYLNQDYDTIKQNLLSSGGLFEDDQFPAEISSIYKKRNNDKQIFWKRPNEFCEIPPVFIQEKIEPNDLDQGSIGDCWVISAMAAVVSVPEYSNAVIPPDQSFDSDYAGIFRFRFWRYGEWVEVVVDDRLPVDENNRLWFCHNKKDSNEMFGPLFEKAYAKLNQCYEFLDGGDTVDALIDMTGGVHERLRFRKRENDDGSSRLVDPDNLWNIIFESFAQKSLVGATIDARDGRGDEYSQENGLTLGHAYTVLDAYEILDNNGEYELKKSQDKESYDNSIKLLKIRNPWGQAKSYTGKWGPKSQEWNSLNSELKQSIGMNDQSDGQFLILFSEFIKEFDGLDVVHVDMNTFSTNAAETSVKFDWIKKQMNGQWIPGLNAGGCGNDRFEDFWKNPQHLITLKLQNNQDSLVSLIISLIHKDQIKRRLERDGSYEQSNEPMNCSVYRKKDGVGSKKKYTYSDLDEVFSHRFYLSQREISVKLDLEPGEYVIIPSLFNKETEGSYLLRLFIEGGLSKDVSVKSNNLDKKKKPKVNEQVKNEENGEIEYNDDDEEYEDEYENNYEEIEIPEEFKANRKTQEKFMVDNPLDLGGQIVSRACLVM